MGHIKRHRTRKPGSDENLYVMNIDKFQITQSHRGRAEIPISTDPRILIPALWFSPTLPLKYSWLVQLFLQFWSIHNIVCLYELPVPSYIG